MSNTIIVGGVGHSQSFHQSPHLTPISCGAFIGITSNVVSTCRMWMVFIPFLKVESCSNNYFAIIGLIRCVDAMHATVALVIVRYATYFEIGFANSVGWYMISPQWTTSSHLFVLPWLRFLTLRKENLPYSKTSGRCTDDMWSMCKLYL